MNQALSKVYSEFFSTGLNFARLMNSLSRAFKNGAPTETTRVVSSKPRSLNIHPVRLRYIERESPMERDQPIGRLRVPISLLMS